MAKIYQYLGTSWPRVGVGLCAVLCAVVLGGTNIAAASYATTYTVEGDDSLPPGTIVVASQDNSVQPATQKDGQHVLGVVAPVVEGGLPPRKVGIVSTGVTPVLVSDIQGAVKSGDRVAVSPITGVSMKATSPGWIIGIVQADSNPKSQGVIQQQVKTADGHSKTVSIQTVPVLVAVSYVNPTGQSEGELNVLQGAAQMIVGHAVSNTRAVIAMVVFSIALILLVVLVYSAVKNSLVAIGRNPLASDQISAGLIKVLLTAIAVIVVTLITVYFILS